jgi:hypothetical protein
MLTRVISSSARGSLITARPRKKPSPPPGAVLYASAVRSVTIPAGTGSTGTLLIRATVDSNPLNHAYTWSPQDGVTVVNGVVE